MAIVDRQIATLSIRDYESRKEDLVSQLLSIAENDGFFVLTDHGITSHEIQTMFAMSEKFFSLSTETKSKYPFERSKVKPDLKGHESDSDRMRDGNRISNCVLRRGHTI